MVKTSRSRRSLGALAWIAAVSLGLGACGGSDIPEAGSAQTSVVDSETGTPAADEVTAATEPGASAVDAATDVAAAGATQAAQAPAADVAAGAPTKAEGKADAAGGTATKAKKKAAAASAGAAALSPVQRVVAEHPIFGGKATCKPATLSEVNIGNVSTLSGVLGELFAPVTPALETFVSAQNACGGLNGHKIKFFQADDQGDPATAASKVQELIQDKKVLAFIGNIQVLTVDASLPIYKKFGVPVLGGDLTSNTWFSSPWLFPQGPGGQSIAYGYLVGATQYHKKTNVGNIYCIEVPRPCEQINRAMEELAPQFGAEFKAGVRASMTALNYVQQCLELQRAGVEALALTYDGASQKRLARSCEQVGYQPKVMPYPLSVGNEKQFLGSEWLGDAYVPMNHFPWMGNTTAAEKYWQASVKRFNPGFSSGGAASLGWAAGALLVAASAELDAAEPTSQDLLDVLWQFNGSTFTELGGLTGPLTFQRDGTPKVPYCLFAAISNEDNSGWRKVISKPTCTDVVAPSDPQNNA